MLQKKRDEITKEINEFKSEYGKQMTGITKRINNGKREHQKLTNLVRLHKTIVLYCTLRKNACACSLEMKIICHVECTKRIACANKTTEKAAAHLRKQLHSYD